MHLHYKRRLVTSGEKSGSTSVKELHDMLSWKIKKWKLGRHPIKLTPPWSNYGTWMESYIFSSPCLHWRFLLPTWRKKEMESDESYTKWNKVKKFDLERGISTFFHLFSRAHGMANVSSHFTRLPRREVVNRLAYFSETAEFQDDVFLKNVCSPTTISFWQGWLRMTWLVQIKNSKATNLKRAS